MRIRSVKPEFFTHEGLFELERETGLPIRISFAGLWCAADRKGRFKWEPRRLGIAIVPYDGIDFSRVLHALTTRGFIVKYRVGDAWFGAIPSWEKHQIVNNRESASVIPDISVADEVDACGTRESRVGHACQGEGKGKEGKGKDHIRAGMESRQSEEETSAAVGEGSPITRIRNLVLDALAAVDGSDPLQFPKTAWSGVAKVFSEIKSVTPEVTVEEIRRRAANYRLHFPDVALTPHALGKHWARCANPPAQDVLRLPIDEASRQRRQSF